MTKEELLKRTLEDLGKQYPIGLYEYLHECHREVYDEIVRLEEGIDKAFLAGTTEELKSVLRDYWKLHMEGIKEFKQREGSNLNLSLARRKIEEERVRV